ncbi:hypothetical protein EVAR_37123_1 [Eumeta japonica]|uniref:Uncharacterized protein n=1 Tax=Eumeta variegata TaxID=151549 RepID=A0A4C1XSU0_EUMVA|nr:hypothetical protein EVAR_37123_1 [Eumeta japonica]
MSFGCLSRGRLRARDERQPHLFAGKVSKKLGFSEKNAFYCNHKNLEISVSFNGLYKASKGRQVTAAKAEGERGSRGGVTATLRGGGARVAFCFGVTQLRFGFPPVTPLILLYLYC